MSDYEVTLVNDNSMRLSYYPVPRLTIFQCSSLPSSDPRSPKTRLTQLRQEFFVRFKGPEESAQYPTPGGTIADKKQHPSKAVSGRFTSSYPINTHTRARASASLTGYSTPTLTSCTPPFAICAQSAHLEIRLLTQNSSGSVCLDVINQTWSPMYDMINIFEVFLPQLLRYPNPTDPLNGEAAALLMREPKSYDAKVKGESLSGDSE